MAAVFIEDAVRVAVTKFFVGIEQVDNLIPIFADRVFIAGKQKDWQIFRGVFYIGGFCNMSAQFYEIMVKTCGADKTAVRVVHIQPDRGMAAGEPVVCSPLGK